MTASGSVKVAGLRELEKQLRDLGNLPAIRRAGRASLRDAGQPMLQTARRLAPDDPKDGIGKYLVASIKMATGKRDKGLDGDQVFVVIGIDANVDPAKYVTRKHGTGAYRDPGVAGVSVMMELGTPTISARPFMRPAWDKHKESTITRVGLTLGPAIEREAAKLNARAARA